MKYYMASISGPDADRMNYIARGGESDLYRNFPEFEAIVNRYALRSIDVRLVNGDRLRIYEIDKKGCLSDEHPLWTKKSGPPRVTA